MISPSLERLVTKEIFSKIVKINKLLTGETEVLDFMLKRLEMKLSRPED